MWHHFSKQCLIWTARDNIKTSLVKYITVITTLFWNSYFGRIINWNRRWTKNFRGFGKDFVRKVGVGSQAENPKNTKKTKKNLTVMYYNVQKLIQCTYLKMSWKIDSFHLGKTWNLRSLFAVKYLKMLQIFSPFRNSHNYFLWFLHSVFTSRINDAALLS